VNPRTGRRIGLLQHRLHRRELAAPLSGWVGGRRAPWTVDREIDDFG
jgi:hypothetical protein